MNEPKPEQTVIKQYLLGKLEEDDQRELEERFITDQEYRDEILMVEDELLEDYVAGTLSAEEHQRFSEHYLSVPSHRQKLKIMQALAKASSAARAARTNETSWFRSLVDLISSQGRLLQFASISLLGITLVGLWFVNEAWRARARQAELSQELARLNTGHSIASPDASVVTVNLSDVSLRGEGELPRVRLTPDTNIVQLRVQPPRNTHNSYRAKLRTVDGDDTVETDVHSADHGEALTIQLPRRILTPNDFILRLQGLNASGQLEDIGEYHFRVLQN